MTEKFKDILLEIFEKRKQTLFYNKELQLNQGGYFTEATAQLVELLDRAYYKHEDRRLPHIQIKGTSRICKPISTEEV